MLLTIYCILVGPRTIIPIYCIVAFHQRYCNAVIVLALMIAYCNILNLGTLNHHNNNNDIMHIPYSKSGVETTS
jgi:hypothetical protein